MEILEKELVLSKAPAYKNPFVISQIYDKDKLITFGPFNSDEQARRFLKTIKPPLESPIYVTKLFRPMLSKRGGNKEFPVVSEHRM